MLIKRYLIASISLRRFVVQVKTVGARVVEFLSHYSPLQRRQTVQVVRRVLGKETSRNHLLAHTEIQSSCHGPPVKGVQVKEKVGKFLNENRGLKRCVILYHESQELTLGKRLSHLAFLSQTNKEPIRSQRKWNGGYVCCFPLLRDTWWKKIGNIVYFRVFLRRLAEPIWLKIFQIRRSDV